MDCQLHDLPYAGTDLSRFERLALRGVTAARTWQRRARRVLNEPSVVLRKLHLASAPVPSATPELGAPPARLNLQPGERVRVKSLKEIRATLDETRSFDRLGFMPVQESFCGGHYIVRKRVERFFDERTREMLRLRDTVILDAVLCEPAVGGTEDYAGCHRSCFLFWKEAWLERM